MLSRIGVNGQRRVVLSCLNHQQQRGFFDYLSSANRQDKGESLDDQQKALEASKDADSSKFSWDFIKWYETNSHQSMPIINSIRSGFQKYEQYIGGQGVTSKNTSIDFSSFRNRIADPSFVDEIEIQFNVDVSTTKSISNMQTLEKWKSDAIDGFRQECETNGDLLWAPMTKAERDEWSQTVNTAEEFGLKTQELITEMQKDYEQVDAERMVYGQETLQMKYSEHPQYAENIEDMTAARQTFSDFVMLPFHNNQLKHERLAAMQDENRRKIFLERFELGSKMINGLAPDELVSGGGH